MGTRFSQSKRLDGWKRAYLSKGGRLTIIQSMLVALPTYFLSLFQIPLFQIPKGVAEDIERRMRDFLWEGNDDWGGEHLVDWSSIVYPKSMGD